MAGGHRARGELQTNAVEPGTVQMSPEADDNESTGTLERAVQLGVMNGAKSEDGHDEEAQHTAGDGDEDRADEQGENDEEVAGGEDDTQSALDGENEDEPARQPKRSRRRRPSDSDAGEDDEDDDDAEENGVDDEEEEDDDDNTDDDSEANTEGVGAVKIRPGDTDEEEEEEEDSDARSAAASESSHEEWNETAANADDDEDEDDEYAEDVDVEDEDVEDAEDAEEENDEDNICFFCKQDEEHGPGEEADNTFLTCHNCTKPAHTACASDNHKTAEGSNMSEWKCPRCQGKQNELEIDPNEWATNGSPTTKVNTAKGSPALQGITANTEGSGGIRVLRKRKTSPAEAADDNSAMSLRKRQRNTADDLSIDGVRDLGDVAEPSSLRSLRIKPTAIASSSTPSSLVSTVKKTRTSLILKMRVPGSELQRIFVRKKRKYTKRGTAVKPEKKKKTLAHLGTDDEGAVHVGGPMLLPSMPSATAYTQPFYSFFDKETEEQKGKPYGGILSEAEADTSKTFPTADDRRRFDEAKQKAEDEWRARLFAMQTEADLQPSMKKKKTAGPASQIECIEFGGWEIDTWYAAPYPEEYSRNRVLYICEFCLKYMNSDYVAWRHKLKCPAKHPPGDEIYRHQSVSVFEVDGRKNPVYCQNLCLLAKLFLGSKTLYYDVEPFLFYVLCEYDDFGYHFVGYFSKEKRASSQNNVSCILTLPIHQRKGYGNLLIDFSYLLTRVEKKTGSPEKPLSDMGLVSYRNYWRLEMCRYLLRAMGGDSKEGAIGLSIKKISDDSGMTADDVISALEGLRCLVRDPQTGLYAFRVDVAYCQEYIAKWERKNYVKLNPEALTWTPYVMGRGNASNFELGPALTSIAPREEDEEHKAAEEYIASLATNGAGRLAADQTHGSKNNVSSGDAAVANGIDDVYGGAGTILESTERNDDDEETRPRHTNSAMPRDKEGSGQEDNAEHPEDQGGVGDHVFPFGEVSVLAVASGDYGDHKSSNGGGSYTAQGSMGHSAGSGVESGTGSGLGVPSTANSRGQTVSEGEDWAVAYNGIPATRFVVYPPLTARGFNYARAPIGRPPGARTGSGTRGRRHGSGYVRRSLAGSTRTPSTATGRRKTGGTGRGPGRWPKGTKKSDYGNADSGPGLPPAWLAGDAAVVTDQKRIDGAVESAARTSEEAAAAPEDERHTEEAGVEEDAVLSDVKAQDGDAAAEQRGGGGGAEEEDDAAKDTVEVHTPTPTSKQMLDKQNGMHGLTVLLTSAAGFQGRSSPRLGKNKSGGTALQDGEDTAMVDAGG